jgi:benzoate-CoA ligase family protein
VTTAPSDPHAALPPWPARFNLCDYYLDHNLARRAAKVALKVGASARTYAQVADRAKRIAAALRRAGVRAEDRVLIVLPDGFEFAEAWFGVLRAGGVFAMVNPLLKQDDFAYYVEYSKARVAIVHAEAMTEFGPAARAARHLKHVFVVGGDAGGFTDYEAALAGERDGSRETELEPTGPDDLAGWLFTSGSTGKPKACVHTHADFAWNTETYAKDVVRYSAAERCLAVPKLFFGYATGTNLMFPWSVGATTALFPERALPEVVLGHIARFRPTILTNVPTMIHRMLLHPDCDRTDLSSLRLVLSAGEALPGALYERWKARTGVEILDGIGSAEMFHIYISNRPGDVACGTLGRLVPGYEARLVGDDGADVPAGDIGTLWVKGGSNAICYHGDREKSRATFRGEWTVTGDQFCVDGDGRFRYCGRADDLLKVGGVYVSPVEVENCILSHPEVTEVAVVGVEREGLTTTAAFVVQTGSLTEGDVQAWVRRHLAPHKYPRIVRFLDVLPRNDRGKAARAELKRMV